MSLKKSRKKRKMDYPDNFCLSGRTFKLIYYWNLFFWIVLAMFLVVIILMELMKDNSQSKLLDSPTAGSEPFHIPDINNLLMWGFNGQGVKINISELYPGHQEEYKNGFIKYRLNKYLSDRISMRRSLPDVRSEECKQTSYDLKSLPSVSVVVVFHNEPRTTLLRMLYSVIDRSPDGQLKEIVLVDNGSDVEDLKFPTLEHYVSGLTKVSVIRLSTYYSIAQARMYGAQTAKGEVLIFLQPRCECTEGWMTPLLECIAANRNTLAVPVVDKINYETFQYSHDTLSEMKLGSFTWSLATIKRPIMKPVETATLNIPNPVIADGIFAVTQDKLFQLGGFDEDLLTENAINIEFSFRSWMCGGQVVLVPCSHVGYLALMEGSATFDGETIRDNMRIADTWMDSYKYFVYERMQLAAERGRQQLKSLTVTEEATVSKISDSCHNFDWYLLMVEPAMLFPKDISRRGLIFLLTAKKRVLRLGDWDGNIVLQDLTSSFVTFWYHLQSGILVTENKACLSYEPDNVKAKNTQDQYVPSSMNLDFNWLDPNQNEYDSDTEFQMDEASVERQNQAQLDSKQDSKFLFENQPVGNKHLFKPNNGSLKQQLQYVQESDLKKRQNQNGAQFEETLDKLNLESNEEVNAQLYETQIKSRSLLNRFAHGQRVVEPVMEPPVSNNRLDIQNQTGNRHKMNDQSFSKVVMKPCENETKGDQWIYNEKDLALQHIKSGLCMEAQEDTLGKYLLNLVQCNRNSWAQQWRFITV